MKNKDEKDKGTWHGKNLGKGQGSKNTLKKIGTGKEETILLVVD